MSEYYKSVDGATSSLELIAHNYDKELYSKMDIFRISRFEIRISNGKSSSTLHIRRNTKSQMKSRLIKYMEVIK